MYGKNEQLDKANGPKSKKDEQNSWTVEASTRSEVPRTFMFYVARGHASPLSRRRGKH